MDYRQALEYLDRHVNLEKSGAIAGRVEGLSLEPMTRLLHVLGDPQAAYPVVHLTGTNGKGSTSRMIAEILAAHGLVVGCYSSPHLQRVNERLWWSGDPRLRVDAEGSVVEALAAAGRPRLPADRRQVVADEDLIGLDDEEVVTRLAEEVHRQTVEVEGRPGGSIDDEAFAAVLSEVAELEPLAGITPSYFELLTAAAFTWFAQLPVDVAVVEVGLLGRYDATNVADAQVAVITNVGQDHTDLVGDWRAAIAREKAGIVKPPERRGPGDPGSFLVLGETDHELRPIFEEASGGRLWVRNDDFAAEANRVAVGGRLVDVRTPGGLLEELYVPVHGEHQGENAALAVAAVEAFFARSLDPEVVQIGLGHVRLPGRFEIAGRAPLVVIDGAHNPEGSAALADTLQEDFDIAGRHLLVLGLLGGRDPAQILENLGVARFDLVIGCTPPSPRALPADEVARVAQESGLPAEAVGDVGEAIARARAIAGPDDVIVVTGSLYVAGAARDALGLAPP